VVLVVVEVVEPQVVMELWALEAVVVVQIILVLLRVAPAVLALS
tara:strand:- start:62 stop:193 length:132 start_codon:yes stop_codon:yes gene_type:complete